ncbi:putative oxalocrotonate tautomerase enzyme-domain-containing protein [Mycena sanguinolenta]|nr:putative oxalocrotonate tautomerase enzyme-domain-containing protein [Mycena sanguinolenta]
MPLHRLFVPKGFYTTSDKAALAQAITAIYTPVIPAFYVVVLFVELEANDFFVGGKATERMVRISVEHLARNFSDNALKTPLHGPRLLWNINGMAPPQENSEEEKIWKQENRAVAPEEIQVLKRKV